MSLRIIPAIMSGGAGTRLWPLSTEDHPKQFHALMGSRTMFAETVARVSGDIGNIAFASPIALCGQKHLALARSAFAEVASAPAAIVIEPKARNTAAVAASAAGVAQELDPEALVLLLPADHVINDVAAFHDAIKTAAPFAKDRIITFGITPQSPAIVYGYIKRGAPLATGVFAIEAFKEKPDAPTAETYVRDGAYSWNSGMFLFSPRVLLGEFAANVAIRDLALASLQSARRSGDEIRLGTEYETAPAMQLDVAVMERTVRAAVVPCDIGWADVGSWAEVLRLAPRNGDGFALLGAAASCDTSKMLASGVRTATLDGEDLVVVAAEGGLMILPRERSTDVAALRALAEKLA
ncbi:mannose-1-phosphate guanylyltransferase [Candidatus Viadribacter manganicus]|uniref:Nucleotidyl transferase domain-containing protein n=1 Tax=Candidatus Viadribacter manganicus TaxID=1759059 RepID=A0A1B1AJR6_9PROT|nr:sugar phosphate nucleotidyltransferase [Candidatus Viadribacter manganicus]ANP46802.1 hypothetical protein ATE48_13215 [Candidatus Viadribacter manganicus]